MNYWVYFLARKTIEFHSNKYHEEKKDKIKIKKKEK